MFELNEAVRGHLIDPKTWDRIVRNIFFTHLCGPWQCTAVWVRNWVNYEMSCIEICTGPEMAVNCRFTK